MNQYEEPEHILEIFLQPGELYWGDYQTRIRTLLGSCVAICLWHPHRLEGGMCHYMLPSRTRPDGVQYDPRYADEALEIFRAETEKNGTRISAYQAKIFGGGKMFAPRESGEVIGERNIKAARQLIEKYALNVVAESLGGNYHRKLHFELWSGSVWQKKQNVS